MSRLPALTLETLCGSIGKLMCSTRQPQRSVIRVAHVDVMGNSVRISDEHGTPFVLMQDWLKDWCVWDEMDESLKGKLTANGLIHFSLLPERNYVRITPVYIGTLNVPRAAINYHGLSREYYLYDVPSGKVIECTATQTQTHVVNKHGDFVTIPKLEQQLKQLGVTQCYLSHAGLSYDIFAFIHKSKLAIGAEIQTFKGTAKITTLAEPGFIMVGYKDGERERIRITDIMDQLSPQSWEALTKEKGIPLDGHWEPVSTTGDS